MSIQSDISEFFTETKRCSSRTSTKRKADQLLSPESNVQHVDAVKSTRKTRGRTPKTTNRNQSKILPEETMKAFTQRMAACQKSTPIELSGVDFESSKQDQESLTDKSNPVQVSASKEPLFKRLRHLVSNEKTPDRNLFPSPINFKLDSNLTPESAISSASLTKKITPQVTKSIPQLPVRPSTTVPLTLLSTLKESSSPPAFKRFSHLVTDTSSSSPLKKLPPIPEGLTLPYHFKELLEVFSCTDTLISMLYNRKKLCTFDKVRTSVETVVKKRFEVSTLGQLRSVYPMAYLLRYEKIAPEYGSKADSTYQLIIEPNLRNDGTPMGRDSPSKGHLVFSGNRLIQRRHNFHRYMIDIVKKSHQEYLVGELGYSTDRLPPIDCIKRWDPRFPLATGVSRIVPIPPPAKPDGADSPKITRVSEAVALFRDNGMVRLANAAVQLEPTGSLSEIAAGPSTQHTVKSSNKVDTSLKGVSLSLIEKIRAKEARIMSERLQRGPQDEKRRAILSRLPEVSTLIWTVFISAKKPALSWSYLSQKISQSHKSGLTKASVDEHLTVLLTIVPQWIERLDWAEPHIRVLDMNKPICEVHAQICKCLNQ